MHEHGGVREGQGAFVADQGRRLGFVGRVGLHVKKIRSVENQELQNRVGGVTHVLVILHLPFVPK